MIRAGWSKSSVEEEFASVNLVPLREEAPGTNLERGKAICTDKGQWKGLQPAH